MAQRNLNDGNMGEAPAKAKRLGKASPMNNSAIGRGGVEVYDGGVVNVSNGNLIVNGTATISGVLNADGTVTLSGSVTISGPFTVSGSTDITGDVTVTGPTHLNGTTDIAGNTTVTGDLTTNGPLHVNGTTDINGNLDVDGTLDINGVATLNNDMNVQGGGIINVGPNMSLNPAAFGGSIQFFSGGGVENASGVTAIKGAGNAGFISDTTASVFAASNSMNVSPSAVEITGPVELNSLTTTANPANVYFDPSSKRLYYVP